MTSAAPSDSNEESAWREELRKKLDAHKKRKLETESENGSTTATASVALSDAPGPVSEDETTTIPGQEPQIESSTPPEPAVDSSLHYGLAGQDPPPPRRKVVRMHPPKTRRTDGRAGARQPIKSLRVKPERQQRKLDLDVPSRKRQNPDSATRERVQSPPLAVERPVIPTVTPPQASPEIVFSRLLTGLIDLVLASLLGFSFILLSTWSVSGDLFSTETAIGGGIASAALFVFSSVFLLYLCGQTPGMLATDVKLVGPEGDQPPLLDIVLRVLLFPIVAASLIGLLWSLFDEKRRCWHDHASRTTVVPATQRPGM